MSIYKTSEAVIIQLLLLDTDGNEAKGATVTAQVYDEAYAAFSNPTVNEIGGSGVTGIYYCTFTPDAEGLWTVVFDCADPNITRVISFYVQNQITDDIDTLLTRLSATRAGYLDELDFDLTARLGSPAGASISVDIAAIKTVVDAIPTLAEIEASNLDQAISTTESNIRGVDSDDLKSISDQIDGISGGMGTATVEKQNYIMDGTTDLSGGYVAATDNLHDISDQIDTVHATTDGLVTTVDTVVDGLVTSIGSEIDGTPDLYDILVTGYDSSGLSYNNNGSLMERLEYISVLCAVAPQDSDGNSSIKYVLGNKTDTTSGDSIVSLVKIADTAIDGIKAVTDNLPDSGTLTTIDANIDDIEADTNELQTDLTDGGRLDLLIDAIKAKTDNLPTDPADDSDIDTQLATIDGNVDNIVARGVFHMDFWADNTALVTLTTTGTSDYALSTLTIADIPASVTVIRAVALLKIAIIQDTSTSDNAVNGATSLVVDADSGYGSVVTAINIPDNSWVVDVSEATVRGGDAILGDNDVSAEITGNGTWYGRLENIGVDGNNLLLRDVGWGIRVFFTI